MCTIVPDFVRVRRRLFDCHLVKEGQSLAPSRGRLVDVDAQLGDEGHGLQLGLDGEPNLVQSQVATTVLALQLGHKHEVVFQHLFSRVYFWTTLFGNYFTP